VLYERRASVFRKTGEKAKALDALRKGRAIMERLTKLSPDNANAISLCSIDRSLIWLGETMEIARREQIVSR
jgi:hypothetical protein